MARRSLKPQLNQIRAWVRQGRTDAWIAHQLEVSATELREFRKQHDLTPDDEEPGTGEVDLRDEIEAEVEAATEEEAGEDEEPEEDADEEDGGEEDSEDESSGEGGRRRRGRGGRSSGGSGGGRGGGAKEDSKGSEEDEEDEEEGGGEGESGGGGQRRRRRRRGRRGGRGRRREIEATFDHGERDGYGLWLDASVKDNPVYSEHWAGKREVTVRIEADQIVIRRAGGGENGGGESSGE